MNPLVISRRFGKLVNAMLINDDPVRQSDLLTDQRLRIFNGIYDAQLSFLRCRSRYADESR